MIRSHVHPRIEARRATNVENQKNLLRAQRNACIAKLEDAIGALKALDDSQEREVIGLMIEVYEWALVELKTLDGNRSTDFQRFASIGKLLKRCPVRNDRQRSITPEGSVCQ